jgi:membrane associated rhomboid family serine protease
MLLPILTSTRIYRFPFAVVGLIATNAAIFFITRNDALWYAQHWGYVPAESVGQTVGQLLQPSVAKTLVTYAFLHGGWLHLIGNLWMLGVFGLALEAKVGRARFTAMYFLFAVVAVLLHGFLGGHALIPCIGASGAISGVMGCYLAIEPRSRVLSLFFLGFVSFFTEIPCLFYASVWLVFQIDAISTRLLTGPDCGNIAWWAHLGGFVAGLGVGLVMARPFKAPEPYAPEPEK